MIKAQQRQLAYRARQAQANKSQVSAQICEGLMQHADYEQASTILWYVHCRSEVRTIPAIRAALMTDQRIVVPYCTVDDEDRTCLGLWRLSQMEELHAGQWGILEPPRERWQETEREVDAKELDLVVVPGVAFDRQGGRLGNGAGYYDRLLASVRKDCMVIGVAYEAQMMPEISLEQHDIAMDRVMTEVSCYTGRGRAS